MPVDIELKKETGIAKKQCFVISRIGEKDSVERKASDKVLKYIIKPACEDDYTVVRADKEADSCVITASIIKQIIEADLVIADLTGRNPNVYYELAIRHASEKPYIHICQENELLPFDISNIRTHFYDLNDLEKTDECKNKIKEAINNFKKSKHEIISPISISKALISLSGSKQNELIKIYELFEIISYDIKKITSPFFKGSINEERIYYAFIDLHDTIKSLPYLHKAIILKEILRTMIIVQQIDRDSFIGLSKLINGYKSELAKINIKFVQTKKTF
jgi:hypothetical protein